jgi:hypothetical protein
MLCLPHDHLFDHPEIMCTKYGESYWYGGLSHILVHFGLLEFVARIYALSLSVVVPCRGLQMDRFWVQGGLPSAQIIIHINKARCLQQTSIISRNSNNGSVFTAKMEYVSFWKRNWFSNCLLRELRASKNFTIKPESKSILGHVNHERLKETEYKVMRPFLHNCLPYPLT